MNAAEVMTSPVVTIGPRTPLGQAADLMTARQVNTLPVVDQDDRLLGVVTETDVLRALALRIGIGLSHTARLAADQLPRCIADITHPVPAAVAPNDDIWLCLVLMVRQNGQAIPVVDHGRVVGIISRREALEALDRVETIAPRVVRDRVGQGQLPDSDRTPVRV
jgi:CBS domain-containing protein